MTYTFYELLWLFFAYSFAGWILETVAAAVKKRTFVNRGLLNGPLCVTYGAAAAAMTLSCHELSGFWLFAGIVILATLTQWIAGHVLEWLYHEKWWDYSGLPWNLDGYICVPASAVWGVLGVLAFRWGNPLLTRLFPAARKPWKDPFMDPFAGPGGGYACDGADPYGKDQKDRTVAVGGFSVRVLKRKAGASAVLSGEPASGAGVSQGADSWRGEGA